jgi:hypothetical protein
MVSIESLHGKFPKPEVVKDKEYAINDSGKTHFFYRFGLEVEVGDVLKIISRFKGGQYVGMVNGTQVAFWEDEDLFEAKT